MVYTVVNTGSSKEREDDVPKSNNSGQQQAKSGVGFWNIDLELQAIKTILTPTSEWSTKVYSVCKADYFHHLTTKSIFSRVESLMESSKTYELPTLDFVLSDSKISPAIRQTLRDTMEGDNTVSIVQSQGDYDILIQGLISLTKTRALYKATKDAANELLDSNEPTDLIKQVSDRLGQSLFGMEGDEELLAQINMGWGYNQAAEDSFSRILNGSFEESKIKTGFTEFDEKTGGFQKTNLVVFGASSGGGKCQIFQSLIPTNQGILQIGDLYNLFAKPDDKGWVAVPEGALQVFTREGIKDVDGVYKTEGSTYKVMTKWGDEFEGLGEHKLYCYDNVKQEFGFKRLDEIQVDNDWILKTVETRLFGNKIDIPYTPIKLNKNSKRFEDIEKYPTQLTSDLAVVFGLIVSEGHRAKSICNNDRSLLVFTQNVIQSHFGCFREIKPNRLPRHYIGFGKYLEHYFTSFTGDLKSGKRIVPKCIMEAPEDIQCAFLRGLYEGDGSIHEMGKTKRGKNSWALQYTSISKQLIYDIKSLLENIGIYCVVYYYEKASTYYLHIVRESYGLFQSKIGFLSDAKKSELARCLEHKIKMNACPPSQDTNHLCSGQYNQIPKQPVIDYINRVFDLMSNQTIEIKRTNMSPYNRPLGKYHALFSCHGSIQKILNPRVKFTSTYTANLILTSHHRWSGVYKNTRIPILLHIRDLIENDTILKRLRSHIKELSSHIWAQTYSVEKKDEVVLPEISNEVHHEVEMTVLIGEKGSNIHRSAALKHVAGYGIGLDMTMRDIQNEAKKKGLPWALAKGFDTSAPLSEFIPAELVDDPSSLHVQLFINGKLQQSSDTSKFVFPVDKVIAYISQFITFEPGDIIFTGTPEGVSRVEHGDRLEASLLDAHKNILTSLSVSIQ